MEMGHHGCEPGEVLGAEAYVQASPPHLKPKTLNLNSPILHLSLDHLPLTSKP